MDTVAISKLVPAPGSISPQDDKLLELLKKSYRGEILVYVAVIKKEGIRPFSDFRPKENEKFNELFAKELSQGHPPPLYVYQEGDKFIMSDDYASYYQYLSHGLNEMVCMVLGDPSGEYVIEKSEGRPLPPPSTEIL